LAAAPADTAMGLILPTLDYSGFGLCDVVIEAVVENMDVKKRVFADLDRAAPRAVLVTNTSSLSVAEMASAVADPSRVAGMHFFNPVHKMPLVEVIRAAKTSDEAVATVVQFSRDLKKTPLVVKDAPGFLVNRVLMALLNEAGWLYEEGTPVADVDRALLGFGLPMGAFLLLDEIGLDIGSKVAHVLSAAFGERMKPSGTLERLVEKKWLGKKSGTGFYLHGRKRPAPNPGLPPPARGGRAAAAEEIVARCIGVMVNEASRCLEEGVVREPADVDLGMILGTGFPPFRGGLLCHADAAGTGRVLADLERFRGATGAARFAPAKLLEDLGRREQPFHASKP
jgi:3-hydroxyacyl-CoA dehydrogenase/enoyl-CoA hydratase/3-hydroxybutyryl-CoA epimerase